jgi:hypothetical protein
MWSRGVAQTGQLTEHLFEVSKSAARSVKSLEQRENELRGIRGQIRDLKARRIDVKDASNVLIAMSREMTKLLREASPARLAELYDRLRLRPDYDEKNKTVRISLLPFAQPQSGGGRKVAKSLANARKYAAQNGSQPSAHKEGWGLLLCPWRVPNVSPNPRTGKAIIWDVVPILDAA